MEDTDGHHTKDQSDHDYAAIPERCRRCQQDAKANYDRLRLFDAEYAEQWRQHHARWIER